MQVYVMSKDDASKTTPREEDVTHITSVDVS